MVPKAIEREFLLGTMNKSIIIKDFEGKRHCVEAKVRRSSSNRQVYLTTGWSALVRANGLEVGDTVKLEFLGKKGGALASLLVLSKARPRTTNSSRESGLRGAGEVIKRVSI